jgi:hypothetical protein
MDFSNALVRCSAIGKIMTEPKGCITEKQLVKLQELQVKETQKGLTPKQLEELAQLILKRQESEDEPLSDTAQEYLMELYSIVKYQRRFRDKLEFVKQVQKGTQAEEDSLDLISLLDYRHYKKNDERLENDFLTGEPDYFDGESIRNAVWIEDVKSSWDLESFLPNLRKSLDPIYYWQIQGYFDLTGAKEGAVSFCLVDTPESLINEEKYRLFKRLDVATEENPVYLKMVAELEHRMRFGDIPKEERRIRFFVQRNDADIEKIHRRVERCRKWLAEFHNTHMAMVGKKQLESV